MLVVFQTHRLASHFGKSIQKKEKQETKKRHK
jgi:hypothetical protein